MVVVCVTCNQPCCPRLRVPGTPGDLLVCVPIHPETFSDKCVCHSPSRPASHLCTAWIEVFFLCNLFVLMYMGVLPACLYVYCMHSWCLWSTEECGAVSPGCGIAPWLVIVSAGAVSARLLFLLCGTQHILVKA